MYLFFGLIAGISAACVRSLYRKSVAEMIVDLNVADSTRRKTEYAKPIRTMVRLGVCKFINGDVKRYGVVCCVCSLFFPPSVTVAPRTLPRTLYHVQYFKNCVKIVLRALTSCYAIPTFPPTPPTLPCHHRTHHTRPQI